MRTPLMIKEINDAIGAHGMWKMRLRTAIAAGVGDITSADAGCDDKCAFGKWIHGPSIDAATRAGMPYQVIRRLHAEFHQAAGQVLARVERGDRKGATDLFDALVCWFGRTRGGLAHSSVVAAATFAAQVPAILRFAGVDLRP